MDQFWMFKSLLFFPILKNTLHHFCLVYQVVRKINVLSNFLVFLLTSIWLHFAEIWLHTNVQIRFCFCFGSKLALLHSSSSSDADIFFLIL